MNSTDLKKQLYDFNNTAIKYNERKTIHRLFEEQVKINRNRIAACCHNQSITYGVLNSKANQLAKLINTKGCNANSIVALILNRSIEMLIAILGVLKSGACYLPIDPNYPLSRINYMLKDSEAKILLSQRDLVELFDFNGTILCVDDEENFCSNDDNLEDMNTQRDLAYMIYTSGSTGIPKGVMIEHQSVHNFIVGMIDKIDFSTRKKILCLTTMSFDIFVLESLLPLSIGMQLIIADPMTLAKDVGEERVDMLQTTPSTMRLILEDRENHKYIEELKDIMIGGETFPKRLLDDLRKITSAKIYNMYGPTETTVWSSIKELTESKKITIGVPIANTQIYVVNENFQTVGIGKKGEICIAGDGIARGYFKRDKMTKEKFIENPFDLGRKMYRTGDIGRWLTNGELEHLGRIDSQVKVRGFRIELGEVENALIKFEKVKKCVVAAKLKNTEEKYLVAYYVADEEIVVFDIIAFLRTILPEYAIPGFYVKIPSIPLTPNGKLNRLVLPEPEFSRPNLSTDYIPPRTESERKLTEIWEKILNCQEIGIKDNFFELGGNSVLVSQMHIELEKIYPSSINIADIFSNPTIYKLCSFIKNKEAIDYDKELKTIKFPSSYYNSSSKNNLVSIESLKIIQELHNKIFNLAKVNSVSSKSVYIAGFVYLLSRILDHKDIEILVWDEENLNYNTVRCDFSEYTEFDEVCKAIDHSNHEHKSNKSFTKDEYNRIIIEGIRNIIPVFYMNNPYMHYKIKENEVALFVTEEARGVTLRIEYNSGNLDKKSIEKLLINYSNVMRAIISELK